MFLSVSLEKSEIASEASAAVSYQETVKNAVSLVQSQILGSLGHVALVHSGRRPLPPTIIRGASHRLLHV